MKSGSMNENLSADDPAYTYPLVLVIRDDYDPDLAAHLLRGLAGLDDGAAKVNVKLWAMKAIIDVRGQVN
jgi:hypothetical protein